MHVWWRVNLKFNWPASNCDLHWPSELLYRKQKSVGQSWNRIVYMYMCMSQGCSCVISFSPLDFLLRLHRRDKINNRFSVFFINKALKKRYIFKQSQDKVAVTEEREWLEILWLKIAKRTFKASGELRLQLFIVRLRSALCVLKVSFAEFLLKSFAKSTKSWSLSSLVF